MNYEFPADLFKKIDAHDDINLALSRQEINYTWDVLVNAVEPYWYTPLAYVCLSPVIDNTAAEHTLRQKRFAKLLKHVYIHPNPMVQENMSLLREVIYKYGNLCREAMLSPGSPEEYLLQFYKTVILQLLAHPRVNFDKDGSILAAISQFKPDGLNEESYTTVLNAILHHKHAIITKNEEDEHGPLETACNYNNMRVLTGILQHPASSVFFTDPIAHRREYKPAIVAACHYKHRVNVFSSEETGIHLFAEHPNCDIQHTLSLFITHTDRPTFFTLLKLWAEKIDINARIPQQNDATLLGCAAKTRFRDVVVHLLAQDNIDVNIPNARGKTPLHSSITDQSPFGSSLPSPDDCDIIQLLLDGSANPNTRDNTGATPLIDSILCGGDSNICLQLINAKADVNQTVTHKRIEFQGHTLITDESPLTCAAERGKDNVVELLLREGANVAHKRIAKTTILQRIGTRSIIEEQTALQLCCKRSYNEYENRLVAKHLLEHNADVNEQYASGGTPLYYTAENRNESMVELLLLAGAKPHTGSPEKTDQRDIQTPLERAISTDSTRNVFTLLFSHDEEARQDTSLMANAVRLNKYRMVHVLAFYGCVFDESLFQTVKNDKTLWEAVNLAVEIENADLLNFLLTDVEFIDDHINDDGHYNNYRVLSKAIESGNVAIVKILIEHNIDVNAVDEDSIYDERMLSKAVQYDNTEIVKLLIENGANVNGRDEDMGFRATPLYHAIVAWGPEQDDTAEEDRKMNAEIIELLLRNGADLREEGGQRNAKQTVLYEWKEKYHESEHVRRIFRLFGILNID